MSRALPTQPLEQGRPRHSVSSLCPRAGFRSIGCATLVIGLAAAPADASAQQRSGTIAFTHASVIDGVAAEAMRDATVIVSGGKIGRVGGGGMDIPSGAQVIDLGGRYLLPGLIDAHVHIRTFDAAERALESGVTTARSMGVGFADVGLRILAASGSIASPEILAAGYHVRPRLSDGFFIDVPSMADLLESGVRGEPAVRRVVRAMLDRGVDWVKTNATERAGLPDTDPRKPTFREAELRALVDEAGRRDIPVAAHAHGDEGGWAAVRAGVRSIEHGTYLSEATLSLMAERGTYLVPTIAVVADLTRPGGDYDNPVLQIRGRHMLPRVRQTARNAHRLGVRIAAATDTGYGPSSTIRLSHELQELVGIGLTPLEAIQSATVVAAELLGVADHTGKIAAGLDADLIVVDQNPLEDIGAIQDVLMVVSDGRVVVNRFDWGAAAEKT